MKSPQSYFNRSWLPLLCLAATSLDIASAADAPVVAVVPVTRGEIYREVSFDAELRPYQEIELHARATGYLEKLLVDSGDVVKEGQLIASLDVPELGLDLENAQAGQRSSLADVAGAKVAHDEAGLTLSRLEAADKAQPNLIAKQDLDTARLKEQAAKAAYDAVLEAGNVAQTSVKKFQTMLDYTQITAPFAGVITKRYSDPGSLIQSGTSSGSMPLVRLSQVDRLRVTFPISMSYVAAVKVGDPAKILVPALGKTIEGKVSRISQKVESATRTMEAQVDLPNPDGDFIAGVYATVVLKLDHKAGALVVPVEAVVRDHGTSSVLFVTQQKVLEARNVTVGTESPTKLEIASGLTEGDLVMVGSRSQFSSGQSVEPKLVELPKMD